MSTTHDLKVWPEYFQPLADRSKNFEVRLNDRDFSQFDNLILREYDPLQANMNADKDGYTGRELFAVVSYILKGPGFGIAEGYCVLALKFRE